MTDLGGSLLMPGFQNGIALATAAIEVQEPGSYQGRELSDLIADTCQSDLYVLTGTIGCLLQIIQYCAQDAAEAQGSDPVGYLLHNLQHFGLSLEQTHE